MDRRRRTSSTLYWTSDFRCFLRFRFVVRHSILLSYSLGAGIYFNALLCVRALRAIFLSSWRLSVSAIFALFFNSFVCIRACFAIFLSSFRSDFYSKKNSSYRPPMQILRPPLPVKFRDTPHRGGIKPGPRTLKAFQALLRRPSLLQIPFLTYVYPKLDGLPFSKKLRLHNIY